MRHEQHGVLLLELVPQVGEDLVVDGVVPGGRVVHLVPLDVGGLAGQAVEDGGLGPGLPHWGPRAALLAPRHGGFHLVLALVGVEGRAGASLARGAVGVGRGLAVRALEGGVRPQGVGGVGAPELPAEILEGALGL